MIHHTILSTGRKMPMQIVSLLDILCVSQKPHLKDPYCHRKLVPKVGEERYHAEMKNGITYFGGHHILFHSTEWTLHHQYLAVTGPYTGHT